MWKLLSNNVTQQVLDHLGEMEAKQCVQNIPFTPTVTNPIEW